MMTLSHKIKKIFTKIKMSNFLIAMLLVLCGLLAGMAVYTYCDLQREGKLAGQQAQELLESAETTQRPIDVATSSSPRRVLNDVADYSVMAKLTIPKLELVLPVISEYSDKALTVSVCYYMGPTQPGEAGNLVIAGHNYKRGTHFGHIDEMDVGDRIVLMDVWGKEYHYEVYEMIRILPDDTESLEVVGGSSVVTLLTCTDNANKRLLVRCKLVD